MRADFFLRPTTRLSIFRLILTLFGTKRTAFLKKLLAALQIRKIVSNSFSNCRLKRQTENYNSKLTDFISCQFQLLKFIPPWTRKT